MVFMHKQRFPNYSLLKMWYITAWRSYKTHRILDRWKMALQFDSSVYWSLTRHVCAKGVCQEVIKKGRWGEKSRIGLQQVLWWVQMWNFWIKWSVYTEVKEVRQLLQSSVKQGGGSILVQGCISASGVGSCQGWNFHHSKVQIVIHHDQWSQTYCQYGESIPGYKNTQWSTESGIYIPRTWTL